MCRSRPGRTLAPLLASLASWHTASTIKTKTGPVCVEQGSLSSALYCKAIHPFLAPTMNAFHFLLLLLMSEPELAQWQPYRAEEASWIFSIMHATMAQRWMNYRGLVLSALKREKSLLGGTTMPTGNTQVHSEFGNMLYRF